MIDSIAQGIAFDFLMDGERAVFAVIVQLHLGGIVASLAVDKVTNGSIFDDHFGPKRVARETEKIGAFVCGDFYDNISPTSKDVFSLENFLVRKGASNNLI